ncbi:MAG: sarcosine oxidase subunit alpha family protein [Pseudomonadota bacterium]
MSGASFRLPVGGLIDRARTLSFTFDGRRYMGFAGDTLASALLANGVRLVGRSFKYHRPRGIFTAGPEEPNALVRLREGARAEPNTRATTIELYDGLVADSQNRWPSLGFDLRAIHEALSPLFPAGFYYKTFMWPPRWWMFYEHHIRRAAGLGIASVEPDPDRYEKRHHHCDVLVVGGGPAGLAAALAAGRTGARVVLADESPAFGGALKRERMRIDEAPALDWVNAASAELAAMPEVRLLRRTTAFGHYDHNLVALVERVGDHVAHVPARLPRQVLWWVRARQAVLATGAIERPLVFPDNDRPGVMLASAARAYVNQFAVRPGSRAVVFTNNDDAYRTALDLAAAGVEVAAVIDARQAADGPLPSRARAAGIECLSGHAVVGVEGGRAVRAVEVMRRDGAGGGEGRRIEADLVCVGGGFNPSVHLHSQSGGRLAYDEALAAFVPGLSKQAARSAGAAGGSFALAKCLAEGARAGAEAAAAAGWGDGKAGEPPSAHDEDEAPLRAVWEVPARGHRKRFIDHQDDVTAADVELAAREGYLSVEHLKRYTTLGMGTDQGKTSSLNGLALMAAIRGQTIPEVGTTTYRPPATPVAFGILAGREVGRHYQPIRRSAMHEWHEGAGAVFIEAGLWLRPRYYPRAPETMAAAVAREALAVRRSVGLVDVSTLGKIEIEGEDAAEFLNRIYVNGWKNLAIGRARYGLMLREDGIVFDDGTTSRLDENRFLMTTTTANAVKVMANLEYYLQVVWPELCVQATSVTEQWAAMALAGPNSRDVLARVANGMEVSNQALPFMGAREATVAGIPARIFRISFSGELAYEINVPADHGLAAWEAVLAAGHEFDIVPYGTEAMGVLRIEKGHPAGPELDGRTTPEDLGLGRLVSKTKDFVGRRLLSRPALVDSNRHRLVGLVPVDGTTRVRAGSQIVEDPGAAPPVAMIGHVTSVANSPNLGHPIALALLARGLARQGEIVHAVYPLKREHVPVRVVDPVFFDPEGTRLHA